jgi:EpsI family protein
MVTYHRDGDVVDAYAAFYGRQAHGNKLVGYLSRITGPEGRWTEIGSDRADLGDGYFASERQLKDAAGRQRILWTWYEVRGTRMLSARDVKLHEGLAAFGAAPRSGVVAISTRCTPDCGAARERLRQAYASGLKTLSAGTAAN